MKYYIKEDAKFKRVNVWRWGGGMACDCKVSFTDSPNSFYISEYLVLSKAQMKKVKKEVRKERRKNRSKVEWRFVGLVGSSIPLFSIALGRIDKLIHISEIPIKTQPFIFLAIYFLILIFIWSFLAVLGNQKDEIKLLKKKVDALTIVVNHEVL